MNELVEIAIKAAVSAGEEIMKIYFAPFESALKADESPITLADINANLIINSILKKTQLPIISEENNQVDYKERLQFEQFWIVDPLDGTKEFIKRNGEFTVNIALIQNKKPVLGVIYVPVTQTLYYGYVPDGYGYKVRLDNHCFSEKMKKRIQVLNPIQLIKSEIRVVASRSHLNVETESYIADLPQSGNNIVLISAGSSLKFCLVAEGKADVYPRFAPTMEWDTAAGHAICNAVGLKVMQKDSNQELEYNKEDLLNPFFIVKS